MNVEAFLWINYALERWTSSDSKQTFLTLVSNTIDFKIYYNIYCILYTVYFKIKANTQESESKQFIFNAYLVNLIKNKTYIPLYNTV